MRVSVFLFVVVLAGCGLHSRGPSSGGLRRFYLSRDAVQGNRATTACAHGFHMASRFEIFDPSVLDYDMNLGVTTDDAGSGPPTRSREYSSPDAVGWIRTGGPSKFRDPGTAPDAAPANCATWSTNGRDTFGAAAYLLDGFGADGGTAAPLWGATSEPCERPLHVWCVEDRPQPERSEREHRRHDRSPD